MTTFIRILAFLTGSIIMYILFKAGVEDFKGWMSIAFASLLIVYALIGHKLKGEGNIYTEDIVQATKKDINIIFKKDENK